MRHLMRYEGYSTKERVDDVLDKISKYGISSITELEKEFLDSHAIGKEDDIHNKITKEESEKVFEDDNGYFRFDHKETEDYGDETHYIGTLYVPDMIFGDGERVEGRINGKIVVFNSNETSPDFSIDIDGVIYDVFDFCEGLEYELDNFIDYIVQELENSENKL